ncbi:MAG: helix-turn-helix transcriptional regulator [Clostridia bacterium]|nr:helix-turn-helix transcriptional regulator [Clostridia bacterium]
MFAETMKRLRHAHHMTQAELAEKLGLSASAVGMYEQGRREPDLAIIMQLCNIFDVPADVLLSTPTTPSSYEIKDVIQDIQDRLLVAQDLTLDGVPVTMDGIQRLIDAIEVSTAVVLDQMGKEQSEQ